MKRLKLKLIAVVLFLLIPALIFPENTLALSTPATPTNFTESVTSANQIYLTWDSVGEATNYNVYRASAFAGPYTLISTPTTTSYADSNFSVNTTYYYKVQAVNSAGYSSDSAIVHATTIYPTGPLYAPTSLNATATTTNQIYLSWNPASYATYYNVYRATSPSATFLNIASITTTNYTDTSLTQGLTYYYKVRAASSAGSSSDSSVVYATTTNSTGLLNPPTSLEATPSSTSEINLTWNPVIYATYYNVYRATSPSGTYFNIASITTANYTDANLSQSITYYYKVRAASSAGSSSDSSIVYATTTNTNSSGILYAPSSLTATPANTNQINLTWNPVSYATYYNVYRAASPSEAYVNIASITTTNYTDSSLTQGVTYYYKVQAASSAGTSPFSAIAYAITGSNDTAPGDGISQIQPERLAGEDMYGTSAEVAKSGWDTSDYAIIVSPGNFYDALCSAPLAKKYNAPLLLTSKDTLNEQTKAQLSRLKVKNVIIIGGVDVISSVVEQSIKSIGIEVSRIGGEDRYERSVNIAQSMGQCSQAVVASGESFPDALSIAPIAAMKGIPILLTPKDSLPDSIKTYLLNNVQSAYVVGGTGVISDNVFNQLPSPKRLSGVNRYETNISIIKEFSNDLDFSTCFVATGEYFPDALTGSALASAKKSPVILVSNPVDQSTLDFFKDKTSGIKKEFVFGGTVIVPDSVLISLNGTPDGSNTLSTPTNITATTVSYSQINLSWDSVSGATSYYVYGATSFSGIYTHIATVTNTSYLNAGLSADSTYYYKVKAVNSAGSSLCSPTVYAKTSS